MCFSVFMTCLSFLLLFHANNTLSITVKHETTAPRIFGCVSLFFQLCIIAHIHKDFWEFKVKYKTKIILVFVQTNKFWKFGWFLRKVTIHIENPGKKKGKTKKTKNIMKWLQSWVLFEWIMRNHVAYSHESKAYRS